MAENLGNLPTKSTGTQRSDGLIALRYEEMKAAKPPIAVTVAPPRSPPTDTHPAFRPRPVSCGMEDTDGSKRDSGLAPTTSSKAREGSVNTLDENVPSKSALVIDFSPPPSGATVSTPQTPTRTSDTTNIVKSDSVRSGGMSSWRKPGSRNGNSPKTPRENKTPTKEEDFSPITTSIPTDSLLEEDFLDQITFSKRGSMMLGGKKAVNAQARINGGRRCVCRNSSHINLTFGRQPSFSLLISPSPKVLPDELEIESQKVRSLYDTGVTLDWQDGSDSTIDGRTAVNVAKEEEPPKA